MDPVLINLLVEDEDRNRGLEIGLLHNLIEDLAYPIDVGLDQQRNNQVVRNKNYYEEVIPNYTLEQFQDHFRMRRQSFETLCVVIANEVNADNFKVSLEKKLLYSIWLISKPESFLAASDRFGFGPGTGHYIFKQVVSILTDLLPRYIKWPENHEASINVFQDRSNGFPGVVGAIDGCHIPCKQPIGNPIDYYNRHHIHSIILQGTCDHEGKFIDIFVGMPGRMHDARVFRNSPLYEKLTDRDNPLLPPNLHLIGDAAYPIMQYIMTPYRNTGHLTPPQVRYNTKLSSIRSIIERAFGCLKGKFRRLKFLDIGDIELGNKIICSGCVLHNFIILNEGMEFHEVIEDIEDEIPAENIFEEGQDLAGEQKRTAICNHLEHIYLNNYYI